MDTERIQKVKEKHEVVTRYPLGDDVSVLVLNKLFGECSAKAEDSIESDIR